MSDPSQSRRAILSVLGASVLFALAAACVKALGGEVPLAQVVLFRSLLSLPFLWTLLRAAGGLRALRTRNPLAHVLRTAAGLVGMAGAFYGYATLPLATVTALGFTMPFFLALLAWPLLGERVGFARAAAVLVGFGGVLLMVGPTGGGVAAVPVLAVLAGAVGWAVAMIVIRRMGEAGESNAAIVFWFAIGAALVASLAAIPGWVWPSAWQWLLLLAVGGVSAMAQVLMTAAYRKAEPTLLAPFEYAGIVWTTALGLLLWAEAPDLWDAAGIAVLVGAGLFLWRWEASAKRPGADARR
jgi:drug/metabolite transporter (DMT)-like permease